MNSNKWIVAKLIWSPFRSLLAALLVFFLGMVSAHAASLPKKQIDADAKWLLHLDLAEFRRTKLGDYLLKEVFKKEFEHQFKLALMQAGVSQQVDVTKIKSITAYGTDYEMESQPSGVLLIQTGQNVRSILEELAKKSREKSSGDESGGFKKHSVGSYSLYSMDDEVFGSAYSDELLILSKSKAGIESARKVLDGKAKNLNEGRAFASFPDASNSFFLLAVAEGFNQLAPVPPQASVLKMAEGGRIMIGEKAENLFLNLVLISKEPEVATQMHQVIQGMLALIALSQSDNKELLQLAQGIQVSSKQNMVTLGLEYPVTKAIEKVSEETAKKKNSSEKKHESESGKSHDSGEGDDN